MTTIVRSLLLVVLLFAAIDVAAERNSSIGTHVNFYSGLSNLSSVNRTDRPDLDWKQSYLFYAAYPSVQLKSEGAHSTLDLNYTFGLYRMKTNSDFNWQSHTGSASFSSYMRRWKLNLSESFDLASDVTTFSSLQGAVSPFEDFRFLYVPISESGSSFSNNASGGGEYTINEKSALSFNVSHAKRSYGQGQRFEGSLFDQYRALVDVGYSRRTSTRSSWRLGYSSTFFGFKEFGNARSQVVAATYSHALSPTLTLQVTGGPSYVQTLQSTGKASVGYDTYASVEKRVRSNTVSLYYSRSNGDTSGFGFVSSIWHAGAGLHRRLSSRTSASADFSIFNSQGKDRESFGVRGVSAVTSFSLDLNRTTALNWGGEYRRYDQTLLYGFSEARLFFSMSFSAPVWRLSR